MKILEWSDYIMADFLRDMMYSDINPVNKLLQHDQDIEDVKLSLAQSTDKLEINYPYLTNFFKALDKGNATVVFLGDSTTEANTTNNNYPHPTYLQDWFNTKYGAGKVTVINSGVSGNDLSLMSDRVAKDVISKSPDCVIICSGWNDSNLGTFDIFEYRYNTIIELIKAGSIKPVDIVLRTPNYSSNDSYIQPLEDNIRPLTEKVAKRNNVGLVDYFYYSKKEYEGGAVVLDPSLPNTTQADFVHPNQQGQELIGDFLKPMFDINGNIGKVLNGVATQYKGIYIEATDTNLVANSGYAVSAADTGHIRSKRLASTGAFPNKVATLNFYGSYVKVVVKVGENMGKVNISIDGGAAVKYDLYELQRNTVGVENFKIIEINGLTNNAHTVTVTNLNEQHADSTGSSVYIDGFIVDESSFYAHKYKTEKKYEGVVKYTQADSATKTTVVSVNTESVVPFDFSVVNDATRFVPLTNSEVVIEYDGLYVIDASISIANATNRGILRLYKNTGVLTQHSFYFDNVAAGDRFVKIYSLVRLVVGDKISLKVFNYFNSDVITIKNFNIPSNTGMNITRIG